VPSSSVSQGIPSSSSMKAGLNLSTVFSIESIYNMTYTFRVVLLSVGSGCSGLPCYERTETPQREPKAGSRDVYVDIRVDMAQGGPDRGRLSC
jgi:hypothetical protein